ncbi:beta-1,3-glucanase family protein [Rhizobacter sp. LjRoot28]|uniref:beta-1,3-glucanase family protein n=1 Tax=Rhizobacter sp. LjRoot28 TaxID=3342309 RepID=UPI003ECFAF78
MGSIFKRWLGFLLFWGCVATAPAAAFTHGVDVAGPVATVWFKGDAATAAWVDIHYDLNGGGLQNFRMRHVATAGRHEQQVPVSTGHRLGYSFTHGGSAGAADTARFLYTVGAAPSPGTPAQGAVCFFEHVNFQGASFCTDASSAYVGAAWNDRISSVKVGGGREVRLYEHASHGGRELVLTSDTPDLPARGFNDLASSLRIAAAPVPPPAGSGAMALDLVNGTGGAYRDDQVHFAILGYDPATRALVHVDRNGRLVPATPADNDAPNRLVKQGQTYANYFHRLSDLRGLSLPRIDSGRLFISLGSPMYIKVNRAGDGSVGFAGPDLGNPSDPNQDVHFEWVEFTLDQYGYHGNTTRVDQFGFPVRTRLVGLDGYDRTLGETESRATLFAAFEAEVPAAFRSLVRRPYRIVAPGKGDFNHGRPQAGYFDAYVDAVWRHHAAQELVFTAEAGTFRGRVIGNDFIFSKDGGPANLAIRGKPSTQAILEGSGNLAAGSSLEKVLQAQMTAAFNRGLLLNVDPAQWSNPASYYPRDPANHYARFWHAHSIDGLAYGFCYDDVRGHSSLLEHPAPRSLTVTVGW